ncbi:MAG: TIGR03668 family PPOX class F420-dependent oxidoreductase [Myxococcales bacterium]|nr:MAG: TIGR03668 family PPOX class F420-dependent oxidoreductase [Myxococcales bacterium]
MLGAVDLPQALVERLLDRWPVARLATLGREGPHQVPVVFARSGALLWLPVDGKPKGSAELARVRHVRSESRVSLLLDHYEEDWRCLWWLRVVGAARVVEPAGERGDAELEAAVAALRAKYPQYLSVAVLREPATLIRVEPVRVRSWCAGEEALARALVLLEARP